MAAILLTWAAQALLLVGLGGLALAWARPEYARRPFTLLWMGYFAAIAFLQAWHLFERVGASATLALTGLAVAGLALRGHAALAELRRLATMHRGVLAASLLLAIWLANRALGPPVGDAGLYHLSFIRWAVTYPLVPGIANLHHRLGFNNPSLLWSAAMDVGPWSGRSSHVANGVLLAAFGARALLGLGRIVRSPREALPVDVFCAVLLPVVLGQGVSLLELSLPSPEPDAVAGLAALAAAVHGVEELTDGSDARSQIGSFATLALAMLAACLKLSMAAFGLGVLATMLVRAGRRRLLGSRWLVATAAGGVLLVLPWLARSVVASGYPLFPLTAMSFPVDWRLPVEEVRRGAAFIHQHFMPPVAQRMRTPGESWVRPWFVWNVTRLPELVMLPAGLSVVALSLMRRHRGERSRGALLFVSPAAAAVVFWLATAPHPRFGFPLLWTAAAALLTATTFDDLRSPCSRRRAVVLTLLLTAPLLPVVHRIAAWTWAGDRARAVRSLLLPAGPDHGFHPTPISRLTTRITRSGLAVYEPVDSDAVWDAPLPATPEFREDLMLRDGQSLERGFRIERGPRP